jgi:hypothetical protein
LVTYTLILNNRSDTEATRAVISTTLPAGLNLAGPVTLKPPQPGAVLAHSATDLPTLARSLTITAHASLTLTFPVTVGVGLASGTVLTSTSMVTSFEVISPVVGTAVLTITLDQVETYLPLIWKSR